MRRLFCIEKFYSMDEDSVTYFFKVTFFLGEASSSVPEDTLMISASNRVSESSARGDRGDGGDGVVWLGLHKSKTRENQYHSTLEVNGLTGHGGS